MLAIILPMKETPIITVDGQSGVGKGTAAKSLAASLGWHYLDSGVLYRATAWAINKFKVDTNNADQLHDFIVGLPIEIMINEDGSEQVRCHDEEVSDVIRSEACAMHTSKIASLPVVRKALLLRQQSFAKLPGLVTDGRDMGTVVFPKAQLKLFLTASLEERAKRRTNQLKQKGIHVSLPAVQSDLAVRDYQDSHRATAPLKPADDAIKLDTSSLDKTQVLDFCLTKAKEVFSL